MDELVEFPSSAILQELVLSFPHEWQGLFSALNVEESQAVPLGTKWFHDRAFSLRKGHISPYWPSLMRALILPFPVVFNAEVIFRPKFGCLTLKLQRNLLSFIVFHSEKVPKDDLEVFLAMLSELPQAQTNSWVQVLTSVLQSKAKRMHLEKEQDLKGCRSNREYTNPNRQEQNTGLLSCSILEVPDWGITKTNILRLENLCSSLKHVSFPGSSLLASNIQFTNTCCDNKDACRELTLDIPVHTQPIMLEEMDIDNRKGFVEDPEVIELLDNSPKGTRDETMFEVPPPPDLCVQPDVSETVVMEENLLKSSNIPHKVIQFKEYLRSSEEFDESHFQEFVNIFLESVPKDLDKICQFMELDQVPETVTIMLIQQFSSLNEECSFQSTVVFADYCVGCKLQTLQQAASRNLLAAVVTFAKAHPKAFVDGIVVKIMELKSLEWPQCDLILKMIKDTLERDILKYLLGKVLISEKLMATWNDHIISIFAAVIEMKLELDNWIFDKFVAVLQSQSLALAKNLKFTKLVLTTINKYGPSIKQMCPAFQQILEVNDTFLKKSALAALKKVSR